MSDFELKNINDVEIFASGTWNGDEFIDSDLDQIVNTFNDTKDKLKPFLKIGHSEKQTLLSRDELPSAGLIENVRRVGSKILADFINVPKKIFEVIKRKAFDKVSAELFVNIPIDGKRHPFALKAVALLGGETPAVHDLDSINNLFAIGCKPMTYKNYNTLKEYTAIFSANNKGDNKMSEEFIKQIATLEAKVSSYAAENAELEKDVNKVEEENKSLDKKNTDLSEENKKLAEEKKEAAIKNRNEKLTISIDQAVKDGDILPAQKDLLYSLIQSSEPSEKQFKVKDKEFNSVEELAFAFIKAGKTEKLNTDEGTGTGESTGDSDEALIAKAEKYAEKNEVSFKEALLKVSKK